MRAAFQADVATPSSASGALRAWTRVPCTAFSPAKRLEGHRSSAQGAEYNLNSLLACPVLEVDVQPPSNRKKP
jgi:hypothetical protein